MNIRPLTIFILIVFILFAVFGLYVPFMGIMEHGMGCPFAPGSTLLCGVPLAHLEHWQSMFTTTLIYLLALCAALFFITRLDRLGKDDPHHVRYCLRARASLQPTLFQELFSRGILHPKVF